MLDHSPPVFPDRIVVITTRRRMMPITCIEVSDLSYDISMRAIGKRNEELAFWATHSGAEVDLFWQEHGKNWAIEVKYADAPRLTQSMAGALKDLDLAHLWILYPGDRAYPLAAKVGALPLADVQNRWIYP